MSIRTPGLQAGGRIEASRMALHLVRSAAAGMLSSIPTSASRALGSRNSIGAAARRHPRRPKACGSDRTGHPDVSQAMDANPSRMGQKPLSYRTWSEGFHWSGMVSVWSMKARGDKPLVRATTWRTSLVQQPRAPGERTVPESSGSDVEAHVTRFMPARSNRSSREIKEVSRAQALSPRLLEPSPWAPGANVVASCHRSADTAEALLNCDKMDACGRVVWCRARGRMPYGPR